MSARAWTRRRNKCGINWKLADLRVAKRKGRNRRRFCDQIGHGPWWLTSGSMTISGQLEQCDSGRICGRCGHYEETTSWRKAES